jgi:hypothetical protein
MKQNDYIIDLIKSYFIKKFDDFMSDDFTPVNIFMILFFLGGVFSLLLPISAIFLHFGCLVIFFILLIWLILLL